MIAAEQEQTLTAAELVYMDGIWMWEWSATKIGWRPINLTHTHYSSEHSSEKDKYYKNGAT